MVDDEIRRSLEFIPGANLRFVGAPNLGERLHDGKVINRTALAAVAASVAERVSEIAAAGAGPGHHTIDDLGHIEVEPGPRFGSVESAALPDLPARKRVARILRLVREAVTQFSGRARGVAVIGVHDKADLRAGLQVEPAYFRRPDVGERRGFTRQIFRTSQEEKTLTNTSRAGQVPVWNGRRISPAHGRLQPSSAAECNADPPCRSRDRTGG